MAGYIFSGLVCGAIALLLSPALLGPEDNKPFLAFFLLSSYCLFHALLSVMSLSSSGKVADDESKSRMPVITAMGGVTDILIVLALALTVFPAPNLILGFSWIALIFFLSQLAIKRIGSAMYDFAHIRKERAREAEMISMQQAQDVELASYLAKEEEDKEIMDALIADLESIFTEPKTP